jgi:hypothetical protein
MNKPITILCFLILVLTCYSQNYVQINQPFIDGQNRIFLPLDWKKNPTNETFIELTKLADSVIEQKIDYSRYYLNSEIGIQTFDLETGKTLLLYDEFNQLIGKASYKNFEYYEDMIEGKFCAHYQQIDNNQNLNEAVYSLITSNVGLIDSSIKISVLKNSIFKSIKDLDEDNIIRKSYRGYTNGENNHELGLICYYSDSIYNNELLYVTKLIERIGDSENTLIHIIDNYVLTDFYIIPIIMNNKPIILFELSVPDTDFFDVSPAYFEKDEYKITSKKIMIE